MGRRSLGNHRAKDSGEPCGERLWEAMGRRTLGSQGGKDSGKPMVRTRGSHGKQHSGKPWGQGLWEVMGRQLEHSGPTPTHSSQLLLWTKTLIQGETLLWEVRSPWSRRPCLEIHCADKWDRIRWEPRKLYGQPVRRIVSNQYFMCFVSVTFVVLQLYIFIVL